MKWKESDGVLLTVYMLVLGDLVPRRGWSSYVWNHDDRPNHHADRRHQKPMKRQTTHLHESWFQSGNPHGASIKFVITRWRD
jgi:hypothetical protein